MLALGYPGGPIVDQLAAHGDLVKFDLGTPKMTGNPLRFQFQRDQDGGAVSLAEAYGAKT